MFTVFALAIRLEAAACSASELFGACVVIDIAGKSQSIDIIVIHADDMFDILRDAVVVESLS